MPRPVGPSDFEMSEDGAFHVPTGAMFWAHPECAEPYNVFWGTAAEPEDGEAGQYEPKYEREEVKQVALELL